MLALKLKKYQKKNRLVWFKLKSILFLILIRTYLYINIYFNIADEEEKKVGSIAEEVKKKQRDCEEDLVKAEPALLAAQVRNLKLFLCIRLYNKQLSFHISSYVIENNQYYPLAGMPRRF